MPTDDNIIWLDSADSTNKASRRLLEAGKLTDKMSFVAAVRQTSGRGQSDHIWVSEAGKNLTFSIVKDWSDSSFKASGQQVINSIVCPVICDFLKTEGVEAHIKLPNDIWVNDRKICGILIENVIMGGLMKWSIIGIGLNLNQTEWPESLPNPVSLTELTGRNYKPDEVLNGLVSEFRKKNWKI